MPFDPNVKPWLEIDGMAFCRAAAALQLIPENIAHLALLQRAADIGASLPRRVEARELTPSKLRELLKHQDISGPHARQYEDPYDDAYVKEISFHTGVFRCLEGMTSRSSFLTEKLLRAIFLQDEVKFPNEFKAEVLRLSTLTLALGDHICKLADLRRGTFEPQSKTKFAIQVPGRR